MDKSSKSKSFAQFVAEAPATSESAGTGTVALTGIVTRGTKEGTFCLSTGGQSVELPIDAVQNFKVLQETGPQKITELQVDAAKLPPQFPYPKPVHADGTFKEPIKDPVFDTVPPLDQPHTLAWLDSPHTPYWFDQIQTLKEAIKDPIADPNSWQEQPGGTLAEGINPGPLTNPGVQGQGLTPFILATPHHAPPSMLAMQPGYAGAAKVPGADRPKPIGSDVPSLKEPIFDKIPWYDQVHTLKEMIKDPITDPNTWWEHGGGTLVEQVGGGVGNPSVWNLPGMLM